MRYLAIVALCFGCSSSPAPTAATGQPAADSVEPEPEPAGPVEPADTGIVLLDAGEEPRQAVRFAFTQGATAKRVVDIRSTEHVGYDDPDNEAEETNGVIEVEATVTSVGRGDVHTISYELVSVVKAQDLDIARKATGLVLSERRNMRGALSPEAVSVAGKVGGDFVLRLREFVTFTVFPQSKIGKGARWQATLPSLFVDGADTNGTYTFELVDLIDGVATVAVEYSLSAADLPFLDRDNPGESLGTIVSLTSTGSGLVRLSLTDPLPITSKLERSFDIDIYMTAMDLNEHIKVKGGRQIRTIAR